MVLSKNKKNPYDNRTGFVNQVNYFLNAQSYSLKFRHGQSVFHGRKILGNVQFTVTDVILFQKRVLFVELWK